MLICYLFAILIASCCKVSFGFSAQLSRPWEYHKLPSTKRTTTWLRRYPHHPATVIALLLSSHSRIELYAANKNNDKDNDNGGNNRDPLGDGDNNDNKDKMEAASSKEEASLQEPTMADSRFFASANTRPLQDSVAAVQTTASLPKALNKRVNGAPYERAPSVHSSSWKALFEMTRPTNIPGVILFHCLGTFLVLRKRHLVLASIPPHLTQLDMTSTPLKDTFSLLLLRPRMWIVLSALLLTSATSMVVNDYYDSKLGHDVTKPWKPLVSGRVSARAAKTFLSYLYAAALVCVAFVPGAPARLSVILGLMLTFWYTKHLKPLTWLKNVICATLIALSPFTSGFAALRLIDSSTLLQSGVANYTNIPMDLWRLVAMLWFGFVGREMTMDIKDVQDDQLQNVQTVPVVYGKAFASTVALCCTVISTALAMGAPLAELLSRRGGGGVLQSTVPREPSTRVLLRRLLLAIFGGLAMILRSWNVFRTEGQDDDLLERAVEEGKTTILLLLASFI